MLTHVTQEKIRESLPIMYWVPIAHEDPDVSEAALQPSIRWHKEEFETPEPPYESVAMRLDPTGIVEESQAIDSVYDREKFDLDEVPDGHAHGAVTKGRKVHDVLNLIVTARGNVTIDGQQFTPTTRASSLCKAVHSFLLNRWTTRPLDHFDSDGVPLDTDDPSLPKQYADEIEPPLRVRPIPGRGPEDVTDRVDAAGSQFDAAVELAYIDTWTEYRYLVREAGLSAQPDTAGAGPTPEPYDTK